MTIFDQDGKLRDEQSVIAREVKKRIERDNRRVMEIVPKEPEVIYPISQVIEWPEDSNVVRMTLKSEKEAKTGEEFNIRLKFISSSDNMPDLIRVMEKKASTLK